MNRFGLRKAVVRDFALAVTVMAGTLGAFGSALLLEHLAHQGLGLVILTVVLALSLGRRPRATVRDGLPDLVVVPLIALGAAELSLLLFDHPDVGDAAVAVLLGATFWARRFGGWIARVAALALLPVTATLVAPTIGLGLTPSARWWELAAGGLAVVWVRVAQALAARCGVGIQQSTAVQASRGVAARWGVHDRMALQLGLAVGLALVIGRVWFPLHWNWAALTATIVCSAGPSRGEVALKGLSRLLGAAVGTLVAAALSAHFPGHRSETVVIIFVLLFLGSWGRQQLYAVWAGCMTCVMALLSGYLGVPGSTVLGQRLLAIALGAACAMVVCAFVVPTTTTRMVQRRRGAVVLAERDLAQALNPPSIDLSRRLATYEQRLIELDRALRPLQVGHVLVRHVHPVDSEVVGQANKVLARAAPLRDSALGVLQGRTDLK